MLSGDEFYDDEVTSGLDPLAPRIAQARATRAAWPEPTTPSPLLEELEEAEAEGGCDATDGCWVEPDGSCEHGHPSWLLRLGMI